MDSNFRLIKDWEFRQLITEKKYNGSFKEIDTPNDCWGYPPRKKTTTISIVNYDDYGNDGGEDDTDDDKRNKVAENRLK